MLSVDKYTTNNIAIVMIVDKIWLYVIEASPKEISKHPLNLSFLKRIKYNPQKAMGMNILAQLSPISHLEKLL